METTIQTTIDTLIAAPLDLDGERVITLAMMDEVHQRPEGTAGRAFREHRERLVEGRHFISSVDAVRRLGLGRENGSGSTPVLLTERGYLLLVKTFRDDLAWDVQERLVDGYFRGKSLTPAPSALDLRDPAALRGLLAQLAEVNLEQQARIADLTPPATAWRELANCRGDVNLQTAGKALDLPPNLWIAWLRQQGILFYRGRNLVARQDMLDAGRFVERVRVKDGEEFIQTLVTPRGLSYFGERRPEHLRAPRRVLAHRAQPRLPEATP